MSCYSCSKKYGFFCKEVGCPSCGFSFCKNCLKRTIQVPKCGNTEQKVCLSCYEKLSILHEQSKQSESPTVVHNIAATTSSKLKKQPVLNVLDEPIPAEEHVPDVDDEIKKRLEVIKKPSEDANDAGVSDRDIGERLANLKGMPYKENDNRAMINAIDKRSDQEKTNDLIDQFMNEVGIDESAANSIDEDPIKSIERRLAALKGDPISAPTDRKHSTDNNDEVEDDDTLAKKIMNKYLDEAALPDSDLTPEEKEFVNNIKPEGETEELPWCIICNEDAVMRCVSCDGDLYCRPCFNEIHANDEEYRDHQTKKYVPKEKQPDDS